jgi:hypothetical protein
MKNELGNKPGEQSRKRLWKNLGHCLQEEVNGLPS